MKHALKEKEQAESALPDLEEKWGKKYPIVIRSWIDNWERLSAYFQYTPPIRKLILEVLR